MYAVIKFVSYTGNLKKDKSPALDCTSTNMLMYLPLSFMFFLTFLTNTMLNLRALHDCWKRALVVPI